MQKEKIMYFLALCRKYRGSICLFFFILTVFVIFTLVIFPKKKVEIKKQDRYAVIFVPGIGVSGLFNMDKYSLKHKEKTNIWVYGDEYLVGNVWSNEKSMKNILEENYSELFCNKYGKPFNKNIKVINDRGIELLPREKKMVLYGFRNMFEKTIEKTRFFLEMNTEIEPDVFLHNFDWRLGCKYNGAILAKVIREYDKVVIVGYSMGGLVSLGAFRDLIDNGGIEKVKGFIACGVPFLGSYEPYMAINTGEAVDSIFFPEKINTIIKTLCRNFAGLYNLLPSVFFSSEFLNKEGGKEKLFLFGNFNAHLFLEAIQFHNNNFLNFQNPWYEYIKNFYIINGCGYSVVDIFSPDILNKKNVRYTDGDGTVATNSSCPNFLKEKTKDVFTIKERHRDFFFNNNVQTKILQYITEIFNIKTENDYNIIKNQLRFI